MALLAKNTNTYSSANNSSISSVEYNKPAFYVAVANSQIMSRKYSDIINEIRGLEVDGEYLTNNPEFCKILVDNYSKPRDNSVGAIMDFIGFNLLDRRHDVNLTINDILFINKYGSFENIEQIYVFKEKTYTEFWFEVNDDSDEAEDEIFRIYSLFKKFSDSIIKIIVFSKEELYEDAEIEYDILLRRKG